MIEIVASNRESFSKLSKEVQSCTCAICLDEIRAEDKSTLD
jgi:hypothetical protein